MTTKIKTVQWLLPDNEIMKVVLARCMACGSVSVFRIGQWYNWSYDPRKGGNHTKVSCNRCGHTDKLGNFGQEMD